MISQLLLTKYDNFSSYIDKCQLLCRSNTCDNIESTSNLFTYPLYEARLQAEILYKWPLVCFTPWKSKDVCQSSSLPSFCFLELHITWYETFTNLWLNNRQQSVFYQYFNYHLTYPTYKGSITDHIFFQLQYSENISKRILLMQDHKCYFSASGIVFCYKIKWHTEYKFDFILGLATYSSPMAKLHYNFSHWITFWNLQQILLFSIKQMKKYFLSKLQRFYLYFRGF